ncbi:sensor histidine kinase [Bacillus sp. CGMCC 1.16607]|uniref:sensor histidine kinase n=1 Tax=Bacillus sp. CGMCC 1.16607 TaxID=3351842 RepID=UPI0036404B68
MLSYTRLIMFILLSYVFYIKVPEDNHFLKIYVFVATFVFFFNHFRIFSNKSQKLLQTYLFTDALLAFTYGFLFPGSTIYLIVLGVVSVTVFLSVSNKKVLQWSSGVAFVLWIIVMLYWWRVTGTIVVLDNLISISFVVFGAIVGDLIRKLLEARETMNEQFEQMNHSHHALSEAHGQLQKYSKQVEELTTIRERNRIAREIHDTVGHKMTALLVQLELGKALIKLDIQKAEETIVVCDTLAREALQEIRFSVRTLHEDEGDQLTLIQSIRKLLEDFYKMAQLETIFELTGDPSIIPISLQPTIIRTIQESLTNAKRHGMATSFQLEIHCTNDTITIRTKDNGKGTHSIEPGFGLINMKERIEEHGGTVLYESIVGEGFQTKVQFPLMSKKWILGGNK